VTTDIEQPPVESLSREQLIDLVEKQSSRLNDAYEVIEHYKASRKGLPILVKEDKVCGVDPERDSTSCPDASLYRHQQGCRGTMCVVKSREYYSEYRASRKKDALPVEIDHDAIG
jgi:hypothetical protein